MINEKYKIYQVIFVNKINCGQLISRLMKPMLMMRSYRGSLYHLTPNNIPAWLQGIKVAVGDVLNKEVYRKLPAGMSFKHFLGIKPSVTNYLSVYDGMNSIKKGNGSKIKIRCQGEYSVLDLEEYSKLIQCIQPDIYVGLAYVGNQQQYQINIARNSKLSRSMKSQPARIRLEIVQYINKTDLFIKALDSRLELQNIQGVLVVEADTQRISEITEMVNKRRKMYHKADSFILGLNGEGQIQTIDAALKNNFKLFEVNFPFLMAGLYKAIIRNSRGQIQIYSPTLRSNLNPLSGSCVCECCKGYSESYLSHLITCKEMTAKVLLTLHNLEQYRSHFNL